MPFESVRTNASNATIHDGAAAAQAGIPGAPLSRQQLVQKLGSDVARQLGWTPADYTQEELAALGEQLIVDHALHGDDASGARLLVALARTAGVLEPATHPIDPDQTADRISAFLNSEFENELAISQAISELARQEMPTRQELARTLLKKIGLDVERRVEIPQLIDPENPLATNEPKKAGDHYFNRDTLSAADIRGMSDRPLSDADVAARLARLPDSLDAEFSRRFDTYTRIAAEKAVSLIDSWLAWIAKKQGVNLDQARVEISMLRLQYYRREAQALVWTSFPYDGRTRLEVPAAGYIATVHAADGARRYFLSTLDGSAFPVPADVTTADWATRNSRVVFGDSSNHIDPPHFNRNDLLTRIATESLGKGKRDDLAAWLTSGLRGQFDKARESARGQTPAEQATDSLLDFIPFRRMIVAARDGDVDTAVVAGVFDVLTFGIPMLCSGLRLSAGAARALTPAARLLARGLPRYGIAGMRAALVELPGLRTSIKTALRSLNATPGTAGELRPLDADSMAAALRTKHPRLASALEKAARQARGKRISDGWWCVTPSSAPAGKEEITPLEQVAARGRDGGTLLLQPYGNSSSRAYTRFDPVTEQRIGHVLMADRDGLLYQTLPVDTLGRYRISELNILRDLDARRAGVDGVVHLKGKTYARIVDHYVEIVPEHASSADRQAWRLVAPRTGRRDIVTHRLFYDRDKELWRQAEVPELRGGGQTWSSDSDSSRETPVTNQPAAEEAHTSRRRPLSNDGPHSEVDEPAPKRPIAESAPALPAIGPAPRQLGEFRELLAGRIRGQASREQIDAVRALLARLEADPHGKPILSALHAYHELRGEAPEIVLIHGEDPIWPRPSIARYTPGRVWNLNLDALDQESRGGAEQGLETVHDNTPAVRELAAVYNNMTALLERGNPFIDLPPGSEPPLPAQLEAAWTQWVSTDPGPDDGMDPRYFVPLESQATVDYLRSELREARRHGGITRQTLEALLRGEIAEETVVGLKVDLKSRGLRRIPPLPGDTYELNVSVNPIRDWTAMPATIKVLKALRTNRTVVEHLPAGLIELNISDNAVETLPDGGLPRGLKSLRADSNRFTEISNLPSTLEQAFLARNRFRQCPEDLPRGLKILDLSENRLENLSTNPPPALEELHLAQNRLRHIPADSLPPHLKVLDLGENPDITALPVLPAQLEVLMVEITGLAELPENLPRSLQELYADELDLTHLPEDLPHTLRFLSLQDNALRSVPSNISRLSGDVHLEGNPISFDRLPPPPPGMRGPLFYLSDAPAGQYSANASSVARAVRQWLGEQADETAQRWDAIEQALESTPGGTSSAGQFRDLLNRLRATAYYRNAEFRAGIAEWLAELAKPERESLLKSTLQACVGATERCDDRVALTLDELRKLRLHDDIRIGRYSNRAADALDALRQMYRLDKLRDIAYGKIESLPEADDVEVYLAYTVELREPLGLSTVVPHMNFFRLSGVTRADLDAALAEVRAAERTCFYKDLVVDDTWKALIAQERPEPYAAAQLRLQELADEPLKQRIRAELVNHGLDPDDVDAQRNIGRFVWRQMEYEVLEPVTYEYLGSAGVSLPEGAPGSSAT
jgi:Leucine-rich repeat (LRR) protein